MRYLILHRTLALCGASALALTGCRTGNGPSARAGRAETVTPVAAADTTIRGVVRNVSTQPVAQVVVRPDDAGPGVAVTGTLRGEIGSLDGVEIVGHGAVTANQPPSPPRAVNVASFQVVSVGGTPAYDGTLQRRDGGLWLAGVRDTIQLAQPVPESLSALVGRRVYVAGMLSNALLRVQAFGAVGSQP